MMKVFECFLVFVFENQVLVVDEFKIYFFSDKLQFSEMFVIISDFVFFMLESDFSSLELFSFIYSKDFSGQEEVNRLWG